MTTIRITRHNRIGKKCITDTVEFEGVWSDQEAIVFAQVFYKSFKPTTVPQSEKPRGYRKD